MQRVWLAFALLGMPALLCAQDRESPFRYRGSGYFTFGGGACQHGAAHVAVGGGGEGFVVKGMTLGLAAAYQKFVDEGAFGTTVLTVGYHFVNRDEPKKTDPFISVAPIGIGFNRGRDDIAAAGHIAGGLNYWFKRRMGIRFEGGVYAVSSEAIFMVRVGMSFR